VGNFYASTVLGLGVRDATAGFRAYRADILEAVETSATKATGYGFQLELSYRAHRLGATIVEVPITFNDRIRGVSKMSWHIIGEAMSLVTWWGLRDRVLRRGGTPTELPARTARPAPAESLPSEPPGSLADEPVDEPPGPAAGEPAEAATAAPSAPSTEPAQ
jgi:hypothetical protein